jgi:hypothetical protein
MAIIPNSVSPIYYALVLVVTTGLTLYMAYNPGALDLLFRHQIELSK